MRIGIDATALPRDPGGAGKYIIQLVRALAELKTEHEWIVFCHRSKQNLFGVLPQNRLEWILLSDKSPARRLVWEQMLLPYLVQELELDLLHSPHYTRPYRLNCASVVTFHDMTFFLYPGMHTWFKRTFFPIAIRTSAHRADALIAVSETTRLDTIRLLNVPAWKIFTTLNGVDTIFRPISDLASLESWRSTHNLPHDFILYLGTLEPRKNLPLLIKALHKLLRDGKPLHLVIAGQRGWGFRQIWKTIEEYELHNYVHFLGYVPLDELPIVYNLARVFVYPSIYEGFGLPPLEAMACGTPVIATSAPALQEQVGDAGLFFPPQDLEALVQALRLLTGDPELQKQLSEKGRERVKKYSWKSCAQATLEVYQHLQRSLL